AKREQRVEWHEGGRAERDAEEDGLAGEVLAHPAPLGRGFAGTDLAVGVEERRVEDRNGVDGVAVALREGRELGPGNVGVGRLVVEVEADGAHGRRTTSLIAGSRYAAGGAPPRADTAGAPAG